MTDFTNGKGTDATTATSNILYLLDTNVLIHYARRSPLQERIESRYGLYMTEAIPRFSYVSEAELLSFALQNQWGEPRNEQLRFLLSIFVRVPIEDAAILDAYARIDAYSRDIPGGGIKMGKNDLWIAATASATAATLLTTDKDFDHLDGSFIRREWIDPSITNIASATSGKDTE